MLIQFHAPGRILSPTLRDYIESGLTVAFDRFVHRIRRVRVFLWDENGPREGNDKGIRLIVELIPRGEILVRDTADSFFVAAGRAIGRARFNVQRELQRRRTKRRRLPRRIAEQSAVGVTLQSTS